MSKQKQTISKLLTIAAFTVLFANCQKEPDLLTEFRMTRDTSFLIPSVDSGDNLDSFFTPSYSFMATREFSENNTAVNRVEDVDLENLILTIEDPDTADFNFLSSVEVYIHDEAVDLELIGSKRKIANDSVGKLSLKASGINLAPYFKQKDFQLIFSLSTDQPTNSRYKIEAFFDFIVEAKVKEE